MFNFAPVTVLSVYNWPAVTIMSVNSRLVTFFIIYSTPLTVFIINSWPMIFFLILGGRRPGVSVTSTSWPRRTPWSGSRPSTTASSSQARRRTPKLPARPVSALSNNIRARAVWFVLCCWNKFLSLRNVNSVLLLPESGWTRRCRPPRCAGCLLTFS